MNGEGGTTLANFEAGVNGDFTGCDPLTEDWIYISKQTKIINDYTTDSVNKAENVSSDIESDKARVVETELLVQGENGQQAQTYIVNAKQNLEEVKQTLNSIRNDNDFRSRMVKFNDNLEKAKKEKYRDYLRGKCDEFNDMKKITAYWYYDMDPNHGDGCERYYQLSASELKSQSVPQLGMSNDNTKNVINYEYDSIWCDRFIKSWDTFLDMQNDTIYKNLKDRESKYGIDFGLESIVGLKKYIDNPEGFRPDGTY